MAEWTLLHSSEIQSGPTYLVKPEHLIDNFNGLKSDIDDRLSKTTTTAQAVASAVTYAGAQTFSVGVTTDVITEKTTNTGVTIDSVLCKDGAIRVPGSAGYTPTTNGDIGYDSTSHTYDVYVNGAAQTMAHSGNVASLVGYPKGYRSGPKISWASTSQITIPAGLRVRSSDDTADIEVASDITLTVASGWTVGTPGLDAGAEASNTFYYIYLIKRPDTGVVSAIFSTVNEAASGSITLPTSYTLKRQLPAFVRNDASSNLLKFYIAGGWPNMPKFVYDTDFSGSSGDATNVGTALSSTSFAAVSVASFVPAGIARVAGLHFEKVTTGTASFRPGGSTVTNGLAYPMTDNQMDEVEIGVSAAGNIEYKVSGGSIDLAVRHVIVTEVN